MFPFNNYVTLVLLFFFILAFADDECILCPLGSVLGDGIVQGSELLWDGIVDGTEGVKDVLQPPSQPPQPNLFLPSDTPTTTEDQGSQSTDLIHLTLSATPDPKPPVLTDDKCDPGNPVEILDTNLCGVATKKIIWPKNCGDVVANIDILNASIAITGSAENVGTSWNRCGTFFWTASLTEEQMQKLTKDKPGIYTVIPNTAGRWNRFSGTRRRIERRDTVVVQKDASPDLSYISTPRFTDNPDHIYARFSDSGRGVRVYIIDNGAVPTLKEFTTNNVIKGYIYGLGSLPKAPDKTSHGNCLASKVGGLRDGVVQNADLIIVQIEVDISSLLDGLQKVLDECQNQSEAGQKVQGHTVVQIAVGHVENPSGKNEIELIGLIQELVERYQVIVVLAAQNLVPGVYPEGHVDIWNEILHREPVTPVIVVGAVDMGTGNARTYTTSVAQDLTVTAPDGGYCAGTSWWNPFGRKPMFGSSMAAAVVSGVVADLLSRDYVREHLGLDLPENQNSIATLLHDYLVLKAYIRRPGTSLCVWNGLYFYDPSRVEP